MYSIDLLATMPIIRAKMQLFLHLKQLEVEKFLQNKTGKLLKKMLLKELISLESCCTDMLKMLTGMVLNLKSLKPERELSIRLQLLCKFVLLLLLESLGHLRILRLDLLSAIRWTIRDALRFNSLTLLQLEATTLIGILLRTDVMSWWMTILTSKIHGNSKTF